MYISYWGHKNLITVYFKDIQVFSLRNMKWVNYIIILIYTKFRSVVILTFRNSQWHQTQRVLGLSFPLYYNKLSHINSSKRHSLVYRWSFLWRQLWKSLDEPGVKWTRESKHTHRLQLKKTYHII